MNSNNFILSVCNQKIKNINNISESDETNSYYSFDTFSKSEEDNNTHIFNDKTHKNQIDYLQNLLNNFIKKSKNYYIYKKIILSLKRVNEKFSFPRYYNTTKLGSKKRKKKNKKINIYNKKNNTSNSNNNSYSNNTSYSSKIKFPHLCFSSSFLDRYTYDKKQIRKLKKYRTVRYIKSIIQRIKYEIVFNNPQNCERQNKIENKSKRKIYHFVWALKKKKKKNIYLGTNWSCVDKKKKNKKKLSIRKIKKRISLNFVNYDMKSTTIENCADEQHFNMEEEEVEQIKGEYNIKHVKQNDNKIAVNQSDNKIAVNQNDHEKFYPYDNINQEEILHTYNLYTNNENYGEKKKKKNNNNFTGQNEDNVQEKIHTPFGGDNYNQELEENINKSNVIRNNEIYTYNINNSFSIYEKNIGNKYDNNINDIQNNKTYVKNNDDQSNMDHNIYNNNNICNNNIYNYKNNIIEYMKNPCNYNVCFPNIMTNNILRKDVYEENLTTPKKKVKKKQLNSCCTFNIPSNSNNTLFYSNQNKIFYGPSNIYLDPMMDSSYLYWNEQDWVARENNKNNNNYNENYKREFINTTKMEPYNTLNINNINGIYNGSNFYNNNNNNNNNEISYRHDSNKFTPYIKNKYHNKYTYTKKLSSLPFKSLKSNLDEQKYLSTGTLQKEKSSFEVEKNSFEEEKNSFEVEKNSFEVEKNSFEVEKNFFEKVKNSFEKEKNVFFHSIQNVLCLKKEIKKIKINLNNQRKYTFLNMDEKKKNELDNLIGYLMYQKMIRKKLKEYYFNKINKAFFTFLLRSNQANFSFSPREVMLLKKWNLLKFKQAKKNHILRNIKKNTRTMYSHDSQKVVTTPIQEQKDVEKNVDNISISFPVTNNNIVFTPLNEYMRKKFYANNLKKHEPSDNNIIIYDNENIKILDNNKKVNNHIYNDKIYVDDSLLKDNKHSLFKSTNILSYLSTNRIIYMKKKNKNLYCNHLNESNDYSNNKLLQIPSESFYELYDPNNTNIFDVFLFLKNVGYKNVQKSFKKKLKKKYIYLSKINNCNKMLRHIKYLFVKLLRKEITDIIGIYINDCFINSTICFFLSLILFIFKNIHTIKIIRSHIYLSYFNIFLDYFRNNNLKCMHFICNNILYDLMLEMDTLSNNDKNETSDYKNEEIMINNNIYNENICYNNYQAKRYKNFLIYFNQNYIKRRKNKKKKNFMSVHNNKSDQEEKYLVQEGEENKEKKYMEEKKKININNSEQGKEKKIHKRRKKKYKIIISKDKCKKQFMSTCEENKIVYKKKKQIIFFDDYGFYNYFTKKKEQNGHNNKEHIKGDKQTKNNNNGIVRELGHDTNYKQNEQMNKNKKKYNNNNNNKMERKESKLQQFINKLKMKKGKDSTTKNDDNDNINDDDDNDNINDDHNDNINDDHNNNINDDHNNNNINDDDNNNINDDHNNNNINDDNNNNINDDHNNNNINDDNKNNNINDNCDDGNASGKHINKYNIHSLSNNQSCISLDTLDENSYDTYSHKIPKKQLYYLDLNKLRILKLCSNKLDDDALIYISNLIKKNQLNNLKVLDLRWNNFTYKSLLTLSFSLTNIIIKNKSTNNHIIKKQKEQNKKKIQLRKLLLSGNNINSSLYSSFLSSFCTCNYVVVQNLDFSMNKIDNDSLYITYKYLKHIKKIQEKNISAVFKKNEMYKEYKKLTDNKKEILQMKKKIKNKKNKLCNIYINLDHNNLKNSIYINKINKLLNNFPMQNYKKKKFKNHINHNNQHVILSMQYNNIKNVYTNQENIKQKHRIQI
ncbi:conserved Plasmodium protein, unknown function [Plasmodium sp. DRC-Itaito]|nr:conserved Plasmodium protein, unknown function [Plasmodium sp. DRC-Itaito]